MNKISFKKNLTVLYELLSRTKYIFIGVFLHFNLYAQSNVELTKSGYVSLIVHYPEYLKDSLNFSTVHFSNPLSSEKIVAFEAVNDSTMMFNVYSFGPTQIYFTLNDQYLSTVLLPDRTDTLLIEGKETLLITKTYKGYFKEIFEHSDFMPKIIGDFFQVYGNQLPDHLEYHKPFNVANDFRDYRLRYLTYLVEGYVSEIDSHMFKKFISYTIEDLFKAFLIKGFSSSLAGHNNLYLQDSWKKKQTIPEREMNFYEGLIAVRYNDTLSIIPSSYTQVLNSIREDSLLNLPSLMNVTPDIYLSFLQEVFGAVLGEEKSLFYDLFIARAYMDQIEKNITLTSKQKYAIAGWFNNKEISQYIIAQNESVNNSSKSSNSSTYYFPFDKANSNLTLMDIISRYKGKIVFVDFWATWCGPCIAAFDSHKEIKENYANEKDIIWIYLTDESSNYVQWQNYTHVLPGEHYYLYEEQMKLIQRDLAIEGIPSYFLFDKDGNLLYRTMGELENKELKNWVDTGLSKN